MTLDTLFERRSWKVRKRAFRIWQHTPHRVAPLSHVQHVCNSCGMEYEGNFCPRCGQSSQIGRFSFKAAFLLFLDIWGIGNRGMFRSIRDLMLRPGYMIRDYVNGKQSAYFPPFKMFFILAAFSLLITHGLNFNKEEAEGSVRIEQKNESHPSEEDNEEKSSHYMKNIAEYISFFEKNAPALFSLIMLILTSAPLYLFIRHCPAIPDLRYPEHIVALVYTSNMHTLYSLLFTLIPFPHFSSIGKILAVIMIFVALKQFTGFSKRRLLLYIFLTLLLFAIFIIAAISLITPILHFL